MRTVDIVFQCRIMPLKGGEEGSSPEMDHRDNILHSTYSKFHGERS
jgi:hypothetical protein